MKQDQERIVAPCVDECRPPELWQLLYDLRAHLHERTDKWDPEVSSLLDRLGKILEEGLG